MHHLNRILFITALTVGFACSLVSCTSVSNGRQHPVSGRIASQENVVTVEVTWIEGAEDSYGETDNKRRSVVLREDYYRRADIGGE